MKNCMPELWAYSKIHTYSIQEEPFLHIDGDVFIWKPFEEKLLNSPLIAQNLEDNMEIYIEMIKSIDKYIPYKPDWFVSMKDYPKAYNAGVIGGTDCKFFKEYAKIAYDFYPQNIEAFRKMKANQGNVNGINLVFEQYLYYVLATQQNKEVGLFTDTVVHTPKDNEYFLNIRETPAKCQYLHFMGGIKKKLYINHYISYLMQVEYPEYWHKIISVFEKKNLLSSYMKHLLQLEKNDRNVNILNPSLNVLHPSLGKKSSKNDINSIALLKEEASEKNICRCLRNSFFSIENMDSELLDKHPILRDVFNCHKFRNKFLKQDFNRYAITQKGIEDVFKNEDFLNYYIFLNPYHDIYITKYNWIEIIAIENEEDAVIREVHDIVVLYLDLNFNAVEYLPISRRSFNFLEDVKHKPKTIGDYIRQTQLNEKETIIFFEDLWQLQMSGIIYFSKSNTDFIALPQSKGQLQDILNNYNSQISKSLQFILNHYKIMNYDTEKLSSLDNFLFLGISIGKVLQIVKELDFDAVAIKANMRAVREIPVPAILLLEDEFNNDFWYVVLSSVSDDLITVYHPEQNGEISYSYKAFDKLWSKKLIILKPKIEQNA